MGVAHIMYLLGLVGLELHQMFCVQNYLNLA